VVAVDPAGGSSRRSDETGIIVAGVAENRECYVLKDLSGRYSPDAWARIAVEAYHSYQADRIVAEGNFGGAMVEATIKSVDRRVPVKLVTASRGKQVRAEPIAALFEQRRVHLVGSFRELEDQLCTWCPLTSTHSPDRLDAMVWAITELQPGEDMRCFTTDPWTGEFIGGSYELFRERCPTGVSSIRLGR